MGVTDRQILTRTWKAKDDVREKVQYSTPTRSDGRMVSLLLLRMDKAICRGCLASINILLMESFSSRLGSRWFVGGGGVHDSQAFDNVVVVVVDAAGGGSSTHLDIPGSGGLDRCKVLLGLPADTWFVMNLDGQAWKATFITGGCSLNIVFERERERERVIKKLT